MIKDLIDSEINFIKELINLKIVEPGYQENYPAIKRANRLLKKELTESILNVQKASLNSNLTGFVVVCNETNNHPNSKDMVLDVRLKMRYTTHYSAFTFRIKRKHSNSGVIYEAKK